MKKKLLTLISVLVATTASWAQITSIPNGNFESWAVSTYEYPQNYPGNGNADVAFSEDPISVTKVTDSYQGTYAVKLSTIASTERTVFGYFVNFNPEGNSWHGGFPYNEAPTGVKGYYKCNIPSGDSALIIVAFSNNAVNIGTYMYKLYGNHPDYIPFNFTFNPQLTGVPDSVMFGMTSSDAFSGVSIPGSTITIDYISFTGVTNQPALLNGDFEAWTIQEMISPVSWNVQGDRGKGFARTTDAYKGTYALELSTTPSTDKDGKPRTNRGQVSTGYYSNSCNCNKGGYPFTEQTDTLAFYYKYSPAHDPQDSALANIVFRNNGLVVGSQTTALLASDVYKYVEVPFKFNNPHDTVIVEFISSSWYNNDIAYAGAILKVDEVQFKSQPLTTSVIKNNVNSCITIFPNPSSGVFQIQNSGVNLIGLEIFNVLGEKVYSQSNLKQQDLNYIDISKSPKGMYFVKLKQENGNLIKSIVIR
jgi:hypothetical protein